MLFRRYRTRRWGKRASALVKLRQRGFRTALPSIHLANLRSLPNKTDELLLLSRTNKDFQTLYKTPSPRTVENQHQTDNLNEFYCRFEKTPHTRPEHLSTQPLTPPATPLSPTPAIQISDDKVCQVFWKHKREKAPGPDGVTPACLKSCADQLAPIFTKIFNRSLELCEVPSCFKCPTIIPIPKNPKLQD